jgi:hypothetical protein
MEQNISNKERELIIARLEVLSPELHFSSGHEMKSYSRNEIIEQIKLGNEVGDEFVKTELNFLRALKDGTLMGSLVTT